MKRSKKFHGKKKKFSVEQRKKFYQKKMNGKIMILSGSVADKQFVEKIQAACEEFGIENEWVAASAHKESATVLKAIRDQDNKRVIFITVAGRSNALSGFCAGHTTKPVIACPPFRDKIDMMVNINSTIQMPSDVPSMTILEPRNAVLAAKRIFEL